VRRGLAWAAGLAGVLAALFLRRRRAVPAPVEDPAEELRQKLAASREAETTEPVDDVPPAAASAEDRRREVHEQARAAIDEMRHDGD
jgi:hypothetical protein